MLIQRKLSAGEASKLIKHLRELDFSLGEEPRDYQFIDGNVGHWAMLPNGATCFYCPPYYGYAIDHCNSLTQKMV